MTGGDESVQIPDGRDGRCWARTSDLRLVEAAQAGYAKPREAEKGLHLQVFQGSTVDMVFRSVAPVFQAAGRVRDALIEATQGAFVASDRDGLNCRKPL